MNEREITLSTGQTVHLRNSQGVPKSAHADETRILLAEHAAVAARGRVLDLGCGTGLVALAAASGGATVVAADVDLSYCRLATEHARLNNKLVESCHSDGFDHLRGDPFEYIYFAPPSHAPQATVRKLIVQAAAWLPESGRLVLATRPKSGGGRHLQWAEGMLEQATRASARGDSEVWEYQRAGADDVAASQAADALADEESSGIRATIKGHDLQFWTKVGVFAWDAIDRGTTLLLKHLPQTTPSTVLDLGCGYGAVGVLACKLYPDARVTMSDVDKRALDCATRNVEINECGDVEVVASVGFSDIDASFDLILSNIPTHIGRWRVRELLEEAREHLHPGGALVAVISRQLTVDEWAREIFGNVATVVESKTHRVFRCER